MVNKKGDEFQINLNFIRSLNMEKIKKNPWILISGILAIIILAVLVPGFSSNVGDERAAQNLIQFINSQGNSGVDLVSVEKVDQFYSIVISFEGEQAQVFVTLDGKYAVLGSDIIPISGNLPDQNRMSISNIDVGDNPVKGVESAKVRIVEFSDYECPFCKIFWNEVLPELEEKYIDTGKVKLIYADYPLPGHENALDAAKAARCVGEQHGDQRYFRMHDLLFKNQDVLSLKNLRTWAIQLGVNPKEYDSCMISTEVEKKVLSDMDYGTQLGVEATPAFFVGIEGEGYTKIEGAQSLEVFTQVIESYL